MLDTGTTTSTDATNIISASTLQISSVISLQISSVQDVDPRSDVLDQPVESLEKPLSGVSAAAHDLPVPAAVHHFQIQNLKGRKASQPAVEKAINEFRWRTALSAFTAQYKNQMLSTMMENPRPSYPLATHKQFVFTDCYHDKNVRSDYGM
jgi:hypothetical protein